MFVSDLQKLVSLTTALILQTQSPINLAARNVNPRKPCEKFEVAFAWEYINFTWASSGAYQQALSSQQYVPQNNGFSGIKYYKDRLYLGLPRFSAGTPVTLASISVSGPKVNQLLKPYPSWEMNERENCATLQNVQTMEIDTNGVMWVLDGDRFTPGLTKCPPKIVLLDLKNNGRVIQTYEVPNDISPHQGGWLNDLVIDEADGGFAYISEASIQDPGVMVYSRRENKAWKFRDCSMLADPSAAGFEVKGIAVKRLVPVDGIALSALPKSNNKERLFYYTPLTGYGLFSISTNILRNESVSYGYSWREGIQYLGRKPSIGDGMIVDNQGQLYFGLITNYGIAKWNTNKKPFEKNVETIYENYNTVDWPDALAFDDKGYLYITSDESERVLNSSQHPPPADGVRLRILKHYTGTNSYLYP